MGVYPRAPSREWWRAAAGPRRAPRRRRRADRRARRCAGERSLSWLHRVGRLRLAVTPAQVRDPFLHLLVLRAGECLVLLVVPERLDGTPHVEVVEDAEVVVRICVRR